MLFNYRLNGFTFRPCVISQRIHVLSTAATPTDNNRFKYRVYFDTQTFSFRRSDCVCASLGNAVVVVRANFNASGARTTIIARQCYSERDLGTLHQNRIMAYVRCGSFRGEVRIETY